MTCSGGGVAAPHNILSATHTDAVVQAVSRGSLIYGDATPAWNELTIGGAATFLRSDGVDPSWSAIGAADLPAHTHSGAGQGGSLVVGTTDTDATAGSVFFAGVGGVIQEDNANFFWDDGNDRLGVNMNSPAAHLEVNAATATDTGVIIQTTDDNTTEPLIECQNSAGGFLARFDALGRLQIRTAVVNEAAVTALSLSTGAGNLSALYFFNRKTDAVGAPNVSGFQGSSDNIASAADSALTAIRGGAVGIQMTATAPHTSSSTNAAGLEVTAPVFGGTGSHAITNYRALYVRTPGNANITNAWGLRIDNVQNATGNNRAIQTNAGHVIFNEGGDAGTDFRVESDTKTHMLFVDAGFESVLINSSADLSSTFGVVCTANTDIGVVVRGAAGQATHLQVWENSAGTDLLYVELDGDLHFSTGIGIIHDDSVAAGYVLRANGTRYVPASAVATLPLAPVAQGDMLVADAVPEWSILTLGAAAGYALVTTATTAAWDQTPTWTGDHTWDDGAGDSPAVVFVGGSNDDTIRIFLDDDAVATDSDLIIRLCDTTGDSMVIVQNSTPNSRVELTSLGYVNQFRAAALTDPDTYIDFQGGDRMTIVAGGVTFASIVEAATDTITLGGDGVIVPDDYVIGLALSGVGRITFDDAVIDEINFLDCYVGIGTGTPSTFLHVYDLDDDVTVRIETDKTDGFAVVRTENDARIWTAGVNTSDQYQIRDDTASGNRLLIDTSGNVYPGSSKGQDLGLSGSEWDDFYYVTLNQGTSRLINSAMTCPVCAEPMKKGTGGMNILGETANYELVFCVSCGAVAVETRAKQTPEMIAARRPPTRIEFTGIRTKKMGPHDYKVTVDFDYGDGVTNSTRLGDDELAAFLAMATDAERKAFLLALGEREWYAREEARTMEEHVEALRGQHEALVAGLVGTDLLQ